MVKRIPDDKLTQLEEDVSRLHIFDVAGIKIFVDRLSITFYPKITYTDQELEEAVKDATTGRNYYGQHDNASLAWLCHPDDLTEDQLKLEYALLLAIWERVDLTMDYGEHGWEYVIGGDPNYCPVYAPAKKLWDALQALKTQDVNDDETHIEKINGRVYVRKGSHEEGFASWADALNAIVEKNGDEGDELSPDNGIKTLHQLFCKAHEWEWDNVGDWCIVGEEPMLVFTPCKTVKVTNTDLHIANSILKHGVDCRAFNDIRLAFLVGHVPCVLLKGPRNNLIRRIIAGMVIALAENSKMYIRHCGGQWKISLDTHTPEAYVNLCNIAEIC